MNGSERRAKIIDTIRESDRPVAAKVLAGICEVSRQIIVQDIALLRASGYDILSTNRGYVLHLHTVASRIFEVSHTDEQLEDELYTIVDFGGTVVNVMVDHEVYGHLEAPLNINSRRKAKEFLKDIESGKSSPLKNITSNNHFHKVEADSEETLELIAEALFEKQYLISMKK